MNFLKVIVSEMNCNNFTFQEKKTLFIQFTFMELNSVRKYNKNCSLCLIKNKNLNKLKHINTRAQ